MNPKKLIIALKAIGISRYRIDQDTGISDGLLSDIVNGPDDRGTTLKIAQALADYAEQFGLDADGEKINRKKASRIKK